MVKLYFLAFELVVVGLFGLCLQHAWRRDWLEVGKLLAGVGFGLLLEWATIQQLHAYTYGRFNVMLLGEVPVVIGVAWGAIIYSAMLFSDATSLPRWARPVLDALLALNIDLAMDAVAIRLGMWDWGQGLRFEYFGVPYENFWAWFWVVFCFSAGFRILQSILKSAFLRWLIPIGALVVGTAGVLGTNQLIVSVITDRYDVYAVSVQVLGALLLIAALRPRLDSAAVPLAAVVPLVLHLFFLIVGIISGVIFEPLVLLLVSLVMGVAALYLHRSGIRWPRRPARSYPSR